MVTQPLRAFAAISLVVASTIACNPAGPSAPGVTTETTMDATTDVTTTGVTTTTESSSGEPTTEPPTTGTSTSGGSTGLLTGDESSSSSGTTSETGEPLGPVSFEECRGGDPVMCPADDPACLLVEGPGGFGPDGSFFVTWSYCSRGCEEDTDCLTDMQGGNAEPLCVPKGPNDVKVCVLDCSFGKTCPGVLECAYDKTCGVRFCDCEGTGCEDLLCTGD